MSFPDESFWVVVGTAAPVIAVAVAVNLTNITRAGVRQQRLREMAGQEWRSIRGGSDALLSTMGLTSGANLAVQAAALAYALSSLAQHSNASPPGAAEAVVVAGVAQLLFVVVLSGFLLDSQRRIEAQLKATADRPAEMHLHLHGVTAGDLAALLARQQPPGSRQPG